MFKNYLTITLRSILKHKTFSAINILGLSLSMSICLILITFIKDQRSFDRFHEHSDRIYRVIAHAAERPGELNSAMQAVATSPSPLAPYLVQSYPGVADVVRLRWFGESMVDGEEEIDVDGFYAEPSFLSIFSFALLSGDPRTALAQPNAIVLTQETAETLFGQEDPMGRPIPDADGTVYVVTGVLENVPYHSHLKFDALVSFSTLTMTSDLGSSLEDWTDFSQYYTYRLCVIQFRPT